MWIQFLRDRFDTALEVVINVKNDLVKALNELKNDVTKQSQPIKEDIILGK